MIKAIAKRPVGRPTKYTPDIFGKVKEYFLMVGREQMALPTVEGLADHLGVDGDTLVRWGKKYPEFYATIKKVKGKQKVQLMNDGMYGGKEVNAAMAIFLLKVNHGMNEAPTSLTKVEIGVAFTQGK